MKSGDLMLWRFMENEALVLILGPVSALGNTTEYWDVFGSIFSNSEAIVYIAARCELVDLPL